MRLCRGGSSAVHSQAGPSGRQAIARKVLSTLYRPNSLHLAALPNGKSSTSGEHSRTQGAPTSERPRLDNATKGLAGSKLPPRSHKPGKPAQASGKAGSSGGGSSGGPGGPSWRPSAASMAGSIGVYTGLVGTSAVVLAYLNHIDLVGSFRWSMDDLVLGLQLMAPLQLMNIAILAPSYSDWQLPGLQGLEAQIDAAAKAAHTPPGTSTGSGKPEGDKPQQSTTPVANGSVNAASERDGGATASTSAPSSAPPGAASQPSNATGTRNEDAADKAKPAAPKSLPFDGAINASSWGQPREPVRLGKPTKNVLRDAMHLAQGHYVSNNPTARLGPVAEAGVLLLDCLAGEMLYRGVGLALVAHWICDRMYEAGADDILSFGFGPLTATTTPDELSRWLAAGGVLAFVVFAVVRKVMRTLTRTTLVLELADVHGSARRAAASSSSSLPSTSSSDSKASDNASTSISTSSSTSSSSGSTQPGLKRRPAVPAGTFDALIYAAVVQGVRDSSQTLALNAIFILTGGNLAASYVAAVANQLVISVLQRLALERMRRKSRNLARELRVYQEKLKAATERASATKSALAAAAASGSSSSTTTTAPTTSTAFDGGDGAAEAAGSHDASSTPPPAAAATGDDTTATQPVHQQQQQQQQQQQPVAAESAPAAAAPEPAATAHAPAGAAATSVEVHQAPRQPLSSVQRTLMALDQLLPPEPPKPSKTASRTSKAANSEGTASTKQPSSTLPGGSA